MAHPPKILIVTAPFYEDITTELLAGVTDVLDAAGAKYDVVEVPGAFEIPAAILWTFEAGLTGNAEPYDGYAGLGCVIRGETSHYDYVCNESIRAIMDLTLDPGLAIVNGILTVENRAQAMARASRNDKNKGGDFGSGLLSTIALRQKLGIA
ncbi:MAG: 6,7-dimethyl-8-ribityllumazine synthase [Alphaproteobacteria bacterium]|nr:MAG: 6,7-dimethyl-8-ribityllumazine synthase [Alphaproteobacteria bacterium]